MDIISSNIKKMVHLALLVALEVVLSRFLSINTPVHKIGFAFGAYGWSGEGGKQIAAELEAMGAEMPEPLFQVKYMPTADDIAKMVETGKKLGKVLVERCQ